MNLADPDTDFERLTALVVDAHDRLSPQLRKVAHFLLENPQRLALMTIAELSEATGVPPSGVIRFSKALGFKGFSDIQRILKAQLSDRVPASYHARLQGGQGGAGLDRMARLAQESLARLPDQGAIAAAAQALARARLIHVMAARRAYGAACYLSYMLGGFGAPVVQVTGQGAMADATYNTMQARDVMVAISFPNYRPETRIAVQEARARGTRIVAITDSALSPIARDAAHVLLCDQPSDAGFRSVVGTMVVAQALALEYGRFTSEVQE